MATLTSIISAISESILKIAKKRIDILINVNLHRNGNSRTLPPRLRYKRRDVLQILVGVRDVQIERRLL